MGDFNSNEDNNSFNNVLYNPYIVDLYDTTTSTNNNNNNNNIINGFIFTQQQQQQQQQQLTNTNNELTIPLTQSIQNLLPPVQQSQLFVNPTNSTSIDINLNQLVYSTPSQQITNPVQPIYHCATQSTTSNIDSNINTINDKNNNNNSNNNALNNNNLLSMCQDPTLILQIQQLLLQQQLLQQTQQQQQQSVPLNIQVPVIPSTPINQQHQALLVPQQKQFYGNVSDNSSPETNFSYGSPSSPSSTQSQFSPYEQPPSPNPTTSSSSTTIVTTPKPITIDKSKESSSKSKSKSSEKEKEKEKEREDEKDDGDDDDRPKKRKKFDKNVYMGVDLGDELLEITSEEFQAYKNNFFANTSDKKTVSALNYQFRESARRSRERKATHVEELEAKIAEVEKERDDFKKENERLRMELDQYKLQEKQKSAGSIFDYISIGSPTTQNFNKNFGIILFLFLFGSFILTNTNPNFFNTNNGVINPNLVYNANNNHNNNNNVNRFSVNGVHSTQQYFQTRRNPLSNLDDDPLESLQASQGVFSTHFVPEQPSILLNRESIRNWATLPQNSVASLSFEKDNALNTIEKANLDKSKHNVISNLNQLQQQPPLDELMIDQKEEKDCNNNNNNNNNENNNNENNNNDNNNNNNDEKGKEIEEIKRKPASTYTPTRYVNNSTISLLIEPTSVIGDIPDDLMKNSNVTTFGENSSFKFNFLIDTQNFPNGSNDISKAFFDNENQQMTVTSVIIAIQKSPKTTTQQPSNHQPSTQQPTTK
ncbi:hypothetical protein ACTFIU_000135 [Dictyostelium citrinum]